MSFSQNMLLELRFIPVVVFISHMFSESVTIFYQFVQHIFYSFLHCVIYTQLFWNLSFGVFVGFKFSIAVLLILDVIFRFVF